MTVRNSLSMCQHSWLDYLAEDLNHTLWVYAGFTSVLSSRILKSLLWLEPAGSSCSTRLIGLFVITCCVFSGCGRWGVALWLWTQLFRRMPSCLCSVHIICIHLNENAQLKSDTALHHHTDRHAHTKNLFHVRGNCHFSVINVKCDCQWIKKNISPFNFCAWKTNIFSRQAAIFFFFFSESNDVVKTSSDMCSLDLCSLLKNTIPHSLHFFFDRQRTFSGHKFVDF